MNHPEIIIFTIASAITMANLVSCRLSVSPAGIYDRPNSLHRSRRASTSDLLLMTNCTDKFYEIFCSSSYGQNYIDQITCDESVMYTIYETEHMCRKNHNGIYCGTLLGPSAIATYIRGNCSGNCSSECRSIIESNMDEIGCCFNNDNLDFHSYFTRCQLNLPSPCTGSSLNYNITPNQCCGLFDIEVTKSACDNYLPIIKCIQDENDCGEELNIFGDLALNCSFSNGQYCFEILKDLLQYETNSKLLTFLNQVLLNCTFTTALCHTECTSTLGLLKDYLGCCYHYILVHFPDLSALSTLWELCNITTPEPCTHYGQNNDLEYCNKNDLTDNPTDDPTDNSKVELYTATIVKNQTNECNGSDYLMCNLALKINFGYFNIFICLFMACRK